MTNTVNIDVIINSKLKNRVEDILDIISLPASSTITMFYKQIVMQNGLLFDAKINYPMPLDLSKMSKKI